MIARVDSPPPATSIPPLQPPTPVLALRLQAHRERLLRSLDMVGNIGCGMASLSIGFYIIYFFSIVSMAISSAARMRDEGLAIFLGFAAGLLAAVAAAYGIHILTRLMVRSIFRSHYRETTRWLYHTDMLRLFVDENQTGQIVDIIDNAPGLRWISPPRPRKLEDLLEFAACYFGAYKRLLYGPGRLDGGSVFLGSLTWYTGQRQCVTLGCCCCLNPYSTWLVLPVWIFTGICYINRLAVEACCLDYLLDSPRDPRDSDKRGILSAAHSVGGG